MTDSSVIITVVAAALTGGLAGTIVTTYVNVGKDGRAARAKVRGILAEAEDLRWLDADFAEFRKALSRLEAAAIIARFDREVIHRYTFLATVAHYQEIREQGQNLPPRTLPLELALLLEGAVITIANEAWRPRLWQFRRKRFIWVLDKNIAAREAEHPEWAWNVTLYRPRLMTKEPGIRGRVHRLRERRRKQLTASEASQTG